MMTAAATPIPGSDPVRRRQGFLAGGVIGTLGGMIGLGGAEFRLPLLVGVFRLPALEAVILNKATSLVVVAVALLARSASIAPAALWAQLAVVLNLLAGSLLGAWWAAGYAMSLPRQRLEQVILVILLGLGLVMLAEAAFGLAGTGQPLLHDPLAQRLAGVLAGLGIGAVAAVLGVAGGELLIPTLVLLYGLDIKLAGSVSLAISLPTMLVGFLRYRAAEAFRVLRVEQPLFRALAAGSVIGAVLGGLLLGLLPGRGLSAVLAVLLGLSAWKTFRHTRSCKEQTC